ncbi:interleukin-12 receptor subunit beta-2 [Microcaecilia unicolor]|uniref:Interleukin-12 receptor subunit beta-2 n=1 Tax=Microcaecilia unicolor TaxID=1415580 RepID=A0A6P7Y3G4_9AMPH|nr:interleukin-12 receptor subunit beta-2 [Microcaecilia unicolor]
MDYAVRVLHWITINLITIWFSAKADTEACEGGNVSVSNASVIPLGSTITISCSLTPGKGCKEGPNHLKIYQRNDKLLVMQKNSSTSVSIQVKELGKTTFTCYLNCISNSEHKKLICGIYPEVGTSPDQPKNLICVQHGELEHVMCTWDKGRNSYINTTYLLELQNETDSFSSTFSGYWNNLSSGSLLLPTSLVPASNYTALVTASNSLGTAVSLPFLLTFLDVVKPHPPSHLFVDFCNSSSTNCTVQWKDEQRTQIFRLRYRPESHDSWHVVKVENSRRYDLHNLEPFTKYEFQISGKFHIAKGKWSNWSSSVLKQSPEAVPVGELDVWYLLHPVDNETRTITLLWKNMSLSEARGSILHYKVTFQKPDQVQWNITTQTWFVKTIDKTACKITVAAYNARGNSPPTAISIAQEDISGLPSPRNARAVARDNDSIFFTWDPPSKLLDQVTVYVVEWAELSNKDQHNLNWVKIPASMRSTLIAGNIKPYLCHSVCVYALSEKGAGVASCTRGYARQAAPLSGPQISWQQRKDNSVLVSWEDITANQQMGCIISYKLYLQEQNSNSAPKVFEIPSETFRKPYILERIPAGVVCSMWMTGSTEAGESPRGNKEFIFLNIGNVSRWYMNIILAVILFCISFTCVCFVQPIRQRLLSLFTTNVKIPDPANCTWAREYMSVEDKRRLHSEQFLSDSSTFEEPETIEIEEVFSDKEHLTITYTLTFCSSECNTNVHLQTPEGNCRPQELNTSAVDGFLYKHQVPCLYKSLVSEELITHQTISKEGVQPADITTMNYLPINMLSTSINTTEESCESESELCSLMTFLPPLFSYEGKLTLDAVKIDCNSFTE